MLNIWSIWLCAISTTVRSAWLARQAQVSKALTSFCALRMAYRSVYLSNREGNVSKHQREDITLSI